MRKRRNGARTSESRTVPRLDRVWPTQNSSMCPFPWFIAALCGWMQREQYDVSAFLQEESVTGTNIVLPGTFEM